MAVAAHNYYPTLGKDPRLVDPKFAKTCVVTYRKQIDVEKLTNFTNEVNLLWDIAFNVD